MAKDQSLTVSLFGRDISFGKVLDGAGKKAKTTTQQMEAMGRKASVVFGVIAAAGVLAVKAAAEDAKGQVILAQTLKNSSKATKEQIAATEEMILKLSLATGVADDNLRPAFARLNTSFKDINKSTKFLNVALDIAAKTSKPLEAVTMALGKAFDGNYGALGKLGLGLDAALIKTKDFDKIMAVVTKTTKGFADIAAGTAAGKSQRLKVAVNELRESFGFMLLPAMEKITASLTKLIPIFERNKELIGKVVVVVASLALGVIAVNGALKVFYALQSAKAFLAIIARFAGFTTAVALAETGVVALGVSTTAAGTGIAAAGAAANIAWAPFLLTIGAAVAAVLLVNKLIDESQKKREQAFKAAEKDKNLGNDLKNLYGITPERLNALNKPSEIRNVPKHALGGIVTRPQIGMIGEAGPEAIIPLNRSGMFGGITVINHIRGSVVAEKDLAETIRNDIAQLMRRKGLNPAILGV